MKVYLVINAEFGTPYAIGSTREKAQDLIDQLVTKMGFKDWQLSIDECEVDTI